MLRCAAVILAAGKATRMGQYNKVLSTFGNKALIAKIANEALSSQCQAVFVVTGHENKRVEFALDDLPVTIIRNEDFANGMGTSIASATTHIQSEPAAFDAILLILGDMPAIKTAHLDLVMEAAIAIAAEGGKTDIVRGSDGTKPGHPILFPAAYFDELSALTADVGAKHLVENARCIDIGPAATLDVDTPEAVVAAGGSLVFR